MWAWVMCPRKRPPNSRVCFQFKIILHKVAQKISTWKLESAISLALGPFESLSFTWNKFWWQTSTSVPVPVANFVILPAFFIRESLRAERCDLFAGYVFHSQGFQNVKILLWPGRKKKNALKELAYLLSVRSRDFPIKIIYVLPAIIADWNGIIVCR